MRVWMKATYDDMNESYGEYGNGRVAESEGDEGNPMDDTYE